jgi:hypothetical protein
VVLQLGELGVGLTTHGKKKKAYYENSEEASDLDGFLV